MLADCLSPNLPLVVCGNAVGSTSAARRQYYAGRGNKFWNTLFSVGLTPRILHPEEFDLLLEFGIGLIDLVKDQAGIDRQVKYGTADGNTLRQKGLLHQPDILCFNGKNAAATFLGRKSPHYGFRAEMIGKTKFFVATSTSGAASGHWDLDTWQSLAEAVKILPKINREPAR